MSGQEPAVKLDDEQLAELREVFQSFDRNKDGSLTQLELGYLPQSLGLKPSPDQLKSLIRKADRNSNWLTEFSEFVALVELGAGNRYLKMPLHGGPAKADLQDVRSGQERVHHRGGAGPLNGQARARAHHRGAGDDPGGGHERRPVY